MKRLDHGDHLLDIGGRPGGPRVDADPHAGVRIVINDGSDPGVAERLVAERVDLVVVESTSDDWRPFFYVLSEQLPVMLVRASEVKGLPERKSEVSDADAEWLADLGAHGLVRASFVPPEPLRRLRDVTHSRVELFA